MPTLSCIGAGSLGKTICHLLSSQLEIQQIINRSPSSSQQAVDFIGAGTLGSFANLAHADIWLIATPDDDIEAAGEALWQSGVLRAGDTVFHCSGSLSASILNYEGAAIYTASIHPIHSFSNPSQSLKSFPGSHCAMEGQPEAMEVLSPLFTAIGALPFAIDADRKVLYHAATVTACNYLVSLLETSQQMLTAAGVDSAEANPLEPLIRQTMDNFFRTDARSALTGPIARGDHKTVTSHLIALETGTDTDLWQQVYRTLGNATVNIAAQRGQASTENLERISRLLKPEASDS
ncbi:MAG: DUF2520 domain-containing protein [Porticoccaceae bacterium]|jgi:predicted short-subunit dehydrogenase-like oxidoreductase (DUF2520 family)|nr:DUF2520 domain-containing protein [Porticoccaceae bacterium]